jgi:group I intron endonuclease
MFIYKITNTINGKIYIGQTIRPVQSRFNRHINDAMNNIIDTHFARAIRKYGPQSFVIETIDIATTQEELTKKESWWIRYYNSDIFGYNETDAEFKSGGNTYKQKTDEEMEIIKEKIRKSKVGANNPNSKMIKCLNIRTKDELFFETVEQCREFLGEEHHRFITTRVLGKTKSLYKSEWAIAYYDNDYADFRVNRAARGNGVIVFNSLTFESISFDSIRKACDFLNIDRSFFLGKKGKVYFNHYVFYIN